MREGPRVEAVARRQVELLQFGAGLGDDLKTRLIQEVTTRQLQAHQAEAAGLHETKGGKKQNNLLNLDLEYLSAVLPTLKLFVLASLSPPEVVLV